MNLLECTKVNTILEFTKENAKIFKKKLFQLCKLFISVPGQGLSSIIAGKK